MLWINGCRHDFGTDKAYDLVVGVAAGAIKLEEAAASIGPRLCAAIEPHRERKSPALKHRKPPTADGAPCPEK